MATPIFNLSYTGEQINALLGLAESALQEIDIATINGQSIINGGNVVISPSVSWGVITGTLSTQTDLQNALNDKVDTSDIAYMLETSDIGVSVQAHDPLTAKTNLAQTWVAQGQSIGTTANGGLTIASNTITLNLGAFNSFDLGVLAAGAYTLANPTGLAAGVSYKGDIKYTTPSSGAVTFAYGSAWGFDGATPSAPTANNATVFFDFSSHTATNVRLSAPRVWS